MSKSKGDRWERHVRNALTADDPDEDADDVERFGLTIGDVSLWYAIRIPSSGSATNDDLPDVHLWHVDDSDPKECREFAAEVKAFDDRTRLPNEEVDALRRYAESTGAVPIVIAHGDYAGTVVFRVDELHSTDTGFTIAKGRDFDGTRTFADFVGNPYGV